MGVVEKVGRLRPIPAPSSGDGVSDEATVAIVTENSGLTIVTKRSGRQNHPVGENKGKFEKLRRQTEELADARDRVRHTIVLEEGKGRSIEPFVFNWLNRVDEVIDTVDTFLKFECQAKTKGTVQGWLAKTLVNPLSKKATKLEQVVVELYANRDFPCVSYSLPLVPITDSVAFESRISVLESIMHELRHSDTNVISVYGLGGVGKTTLVKEVYMKAIKERLFDDVVMVLDLKYSPDLGRIQQEILDKLGMDVLSEFTVVGRARRLSERIKDKKTLVILDDVWETIDLEAIGLQGAANCKILLTSRSRLVLSGDMRTTQKAFPLDVLWEEESWSLFEKIVGDVVKQDHVRSIAIQIAKLCGGLPILIVTVARALQYTSTLHEWKDVLRRLNRFDNKDLSSRAGLSLEWSYNQLSDGELRQLFLLCGITAARSTDSIVLGDLLKYGLGLGLFENADTVEEACDTLHSLVSKLKDCCLLQDSYDVTRIRMHDLVRDVATRIAARDHCVLSIAYGAELEEWPSEVFFQKCTMINLPSCKIPRFPSVPWVCPELKMFVLRGTDRDILEIPFNFFEEMKVLRVLDLTNLCIQSLQSLQVLTNLQTLCLDQCVLEDIAILGQLRRLEVLSFFNSEFKQLPREIAELTCLRLLDLTDCSELETIPPNVISSLRRLEDLRMRNSFNNWEAEQVIGGRTNASLSELKYLTHLTALDIHIPDGNMLPANVFSSKLKRYHIIIGDEWTWHNVDETSNTVKLKLTPSNVQLDQGLKMLLKRADDLHLDLLEDVGDIVDQFDNDDFQQLKHLHVQNSAYAGSKEIILENELGSLVQHFISEKVSLHNLRSLSLYQCGGSRFLLSFSMASSLVKLSHLQISRCGSLEEIVSTDNMSGNVFPNLEILEVVDCGRLKTIGLSAASFVNLKTLEVIGCHELKYLTTNSISKNLAQLRRMEVKNCNRLIVLVVSNGDRGGENEILFNSMQYLELSSLPSLQGFCSAHCIATFPVLETILVSDCPVEMKISPDGVLQSESKPQRVITREVREEADDDHDDDDNKHVGRSANFITMPPSECLEQAVQNHAREIEADPSEPQKGADKRKQKMYPEEASNPQISETIAPEIQISQMREEQASVIRVDFPGSPIHKEEAIDAEKKEKENGSQFGLSICPLMVPQIEPNFAFLQRHLSPKERNLQEKTSYPITVLPKARLPLTATQQRLQAAIGLLRPPSSSSPQSPEVAAAKATLLELVNNPIDEVVDHDHDLQSTFHSACTILVKQQVLSAGVVQGLDALLLELYRSNQHCCTITSDLAAIKPDQEAYIANSIESLAQICAEQEQRSHQHAERISMLRQELLLEEEAKAKVDQELEDNLKQLDPLQDQLVAIRNDVTRSEALQVELISQKNKFGAIWDSIRFIVHEQLNN